MSAVFQKRQWHDGGNDALDFAVDVGKNNEFEPDHEPDPLQPLRKVVAGAVELAAQSPEQIAIECEEQDELLGLPKGSTLEMFLSAYQQSH